MKVAGNDIRITIYQMQFNSYDFSSQKLIMKPLNFIRSQPL